jgi:hypothetical protein
MREINRLFNFDKMRISCIPYIIACVFVAAETILPSRCLTKLGEYMHICMIPAYIYIYICIYIYGGWNQGFLKHAVGMGLDAMNSVASFIKFGSAIQKFLWVMHRCDRLCSLVVRVLGYRSGGSGSIPGTTRKINSSGSGTGSTQTRGYN